MNVLGSFASLCKKKMYVIKQKKMSVNMRLRRTEEDVVVILCFHSVLR